MDLLQNKFDETEEKYPPESGIVSTGVPLSGLRWGNYKINRYN